MLCPGPPPGVVAVPAPGWAPLLAEIPDLAAIGALTAGLVGAAAVEQSRLA